MFILQVVKIAFFFIKKKVKLTGLTGLSDEMFSELNQKLKSSGVSEYVLGLKELYVDFLGKKKRERERGGGDKALISL